MKKIKGIFFFLIVLLCLSAIHVNAQAKDLVMWWWGGQESPGLEDFIKDSVKEYEKKTGVKIVDILQPTDNLIPAFRAAAEGKSKLDIATVWYGVYQLEEIWENNLAPLDNLVSKEEINHWLGKGMSEYDGKIWGCDLYGYGNIMVYNKNLFRKANLDSEKPPLTWEEFLDVCEKLKNAGIAPVSVGFKDPGFEVAVLSCHFWPQYFTSRDAVKEAVIGERSFTDPEFVDMWYRLDELNKKGYLIEGCMSIPLEESYAELVKNNAAFAFINTQQAIHYYNDFGADAIGFMSFPSVTGEPVDWIPVAPITLFVTSWSENKEIAADFLKYLHSEERMNALLEITNYSTYQADDRFDFSKIEDPQVRYIFELIEGGFKKGSWFTDALMPYYIIESGLIPAGQKLILGMISPEEAGKMVEEVARTWRQMNPQAVENYKKWMSR